MRLIIACLLIIGLTESLYSQNFYAVSGIPDSLKTKADAVVRFNTTRYTRQSIDKVVEYHVYAITIFNKNGDKFSKLYVPYDKNISVSYINANVYDAFGKVTEKLKKSNINDYASYPDFTLFSDNRVKSVNPLITQYPCTIEYEYEVVENGVIGFSPWIPQDDYRLAVQNAELIYLTPENVSFKYKNLNFTPVFSKEKEGPYMRYSWKVSGMKAIEKEQFSPSMQDFLPVVHLAPNEFKYEGYPGSLQTWNDYGKWAFNLNLGRDELPPASIAAVKELVKDIRDTMELVKAVYQYMQGKTRYVSVQLGIGGLQPMKAMDVDKYGYGDCKALSNYTQALLKAVGVNSYYAVIGSGSYRKIRFPDFASLNQNNHVILCVPFSKDTLWLECTSQNVPAGYIGMSNSDRYALLITPEGGKLVKTPVYKKEVNKQEFVTQVSIGEDGKADFTTTFNFMGGLYDHVLSYTLMNDKERREKLMKDISLNSLTINKVVVNNQKNLNPKLSLDLDLTATKYGSLSSGRMFVELNPFNKWSIKLENNESRYTDIAINIDYVEVDTVCFKIPATFAVEFVPGEVFFESVFGTYKASIRKEKDSVYYTRTLTINEGRYEKSMYADFTRFFENVAKADNSKMLLKRI